MLCVTIGHGQAEENRNNKSRIHSPPPPHMLCVTIGHGQAEENKNNKKSRIHAPPCVTTGHGQDMEPLFLHENKSDQVSWNMPPLPRVIHYSMYACVHVRMCVCVCVLFPHLHVHISPACLALWLSVPRHAVIGPLRTDTCQQVNTAPHSWRVPSNNTQWHVPSNNTQWHVPSNNTQSFRSPTLPPPPNYFPPEFTESKISGDSSGAIRQLTLVNVHLPHLMHFHPPPAFKKIGKTCPSLY